MAHSSKGREITRALAGPSRAFRPLIGHVLNAELSPSRLREQVEVFGRAGYGGILVMPWRPLPCKVMDEAWLEAVEVILEEAKQENLEVWIWDDWVFPSGMGGGLVTESPRHRAKRLYLAIDALLAPGESLDCTAPPRMVAAAACPTDKYGAPIGAWRPLSGKPGPRLSCKAADRRERCVVVCWDYFSAHADTIDGRGDVHSVDMLSAAATDRFLEVIHERYARRLGRYFGEPLKGFFYDEPTQAVPFPWTDGFLAAFKERKGRDLAPDLPAILSGQSTVFTDPSGSPLGRVRALADDYLDVWTDLVAENFYGRIETWCHEHGVLSVGHQDMDHRLLNLATVSGHFFKNSSHSDHPGIDVIFSNILPGRFVDFPRYAGSAARILGKPRALSESLAAGGWGMSPDSIRYVLEHQIIRGVNQFFLMQCLYNGSAYGIGFGPDLCPWSNPVIEEFSPPLNERIGRMCALSCAGRSAAQTCLYLPLHDIAALQTVLSQPHTGNHSLPWTEIEEIAAVLTYSPCEFDYLWDEGILSLDLTKGGFGSPTGAVYTTVVLPPGCKLKAAIVERLAAFARKGGRLLAMDRTPKELSECATECTGLGDLLTKVPRAVILEGQPRHRVSLSGRRDGKRDLWMLLNEGTVPVELAVTFPGSGSIAEIDPGDGSTTELLRGGILRLPVRFEPTECRVFIRQPARVRTPKAPPERTGSPVNILNWVLVLPDGKRRSLTKGFPDWCELGFTTFTGRMDYTAEFDWPSGTDSGLLELGEVCYAATVQVDDRKETVRVPFRPFRARLRGLAPGRHVLKIRVFNTQANDHCGDPRVNYWGRNLDRQVLRSGLFGPVRLTSLCTQGWPGNADEMLPAVCCQSRTGGRINKGDRIWDSPPVVPRAGRLGSGSPREAKCHAAHLGRPVSGADGGGDRS